MVTSYDFYITIYGGEMVEDEARFAILERRALLYFDRMTFDRLHKGWRVTEAIKMTICQLIDLEAEKDRRMKESGVSGLASETVDGYSVSYRDQMSLAEQDEKRAYTIMYTNLAHTGIMARSVCSGR